MTTQAPVAPKATGISTVIDTIVSPGDAFERLAVAPTWGWACLIALVLLFCGMYLEGPALTHAGYATMQHMLATNPFFANVPAAKKAEMLSGAAHPKAAALIGRYVFVAVFLFIAVLFNTLFMLIGNAAGGGKADFKQLWAGSMNIAVPTMGFAVLLTGALAAFHGPDTFNSNLDMVRLLPGLGWLAPGGSPMLDGFLSAITIFALWGMFLNATMLRRLAKTGAGVAWTFAVLVLLLGAAVGAAGGMMSARFGG